MQRGPGIPGISVLPCHGFLVMVLMSKNMPFKNTLLQIHFYHEK